MSSQLSADTAGIVLEPDVMLVTAAGVSGNKVIVTYWEASYQGVWKTCPASRRQEVCPDGIFSQLCCSTESEGWPLPTPHSSSFKRRHLLK